MTTLPRVSKTIDKEKTLKKAKPSLIYFIGVYRPPGPGLKELPLPFI